MTVSAEDLGYEVAEPSAASLGYDLKYSSPSPEELGYGYDSHSTLPTPEELGYDVEMPTHADLGYDVDITEPKPMFPCSRHRGDLLERSSSSFDAPPAQPLRRTSGPKEPEELPFRTRDRRNGPPRQPQRSNRRAMRRASTTGSTAATVTARPRLQMQRRITMDVSHAVPQLSTPEHHTKAPRRSSMKSYSSFQDDDSILSISLGEGSFRQKAQRRVSFGSSATINHVEHLHATEQDKKELYYDREELSCLRRQLKKIASQAHETGIDEAEETLRGLENYVKRAKQGKKSRSVSETELCNQIMLQLQQKLKQKQMMEEHSHYNSDTDTCSCYDSDDSSIMDSDDELVMNLQLSAKRLLRRASQTGVRLADKDAAEARAIYLESLPQEQVCAYFVNPPSNSFGSGGKRRKGKTTNYNRQQLRASAKY